VKLLGFSAYLSTLFLNHRKHQGSKRTVPVLPPCFRKGNCVACFQYGEKEINYLKKRDKKLGQIIDEIGFIQRATNPDIFAALIESIISQQVSKQAAQTVYNRLVHLTGSLSAETIAALGIDDIKQCGISLRKAGYIKGIADAALAGEVDFAKLAALSDEEIIRQLTRLKGVGVWTVEMLLIFSLQRPDVVSFGDLGIRRGMMKLYGLPDLSRDTFQQYRSCYSPFGSVASLYLWAVSK